MRCRAWWQGLTVEDVLAKWELEGQGLPDQDRGRGKGKPLEVEAAVKDLLAGLSTFLGENHISASLDPPKRAPHWLDWPFGFGSQGAMHPESNPPQQTPDL